MLNYFAPIVTIIALGVIIARIKYVSNHGTENKRDFLEAVWSFIILGMAICGIIARKELFLSSPIFFAALIIISLEVLWLLSVSISLIIEIISYCFLKYCVMFPSTKEAASLLIRKGHDIKNQSRSLIESEGIYFWIIDEDHIISLSGTLLYSAPEDYQTIEVGEVIKIGYAEYKLETDSAKELFLTELEFSGKEKISYTY